MKKQVLTPSKKTPLILAGTLAIFASLTVWFQYTYEKKEDRLKRQANYPMTLPSLNSQVAMIKIKSHHGLIELKCESVSENKCTPRTSAVWKIGNDLVDADKVKDFLYAVTGTGGETIDLSTETSEKRKMLLTEYGLNEDQRASGESQFVELTVVDEKGAPISHLTEWFGNDYPIGEKVFVGSTLGSTGDGKMNEQKIFLPSGKLKTKVFDIPLK